MKSACWLMYVLEGKDIVVYKHCFCYEKFVTSKTKERFFFPRTTALLFGTLISTGHVTQPLLHHHHYSSIAFPHAAFL